MGRRTQQSQPTVAIEITRTQLLATILRPQSGNARPQVHIREIEWRKTATTLASDIGATEFATALKALVTEEKLTGCEAGVCLNEEFCVTRIVTGATDRVRKELLQLEERSSLYLTLGAGPKTHARSLRQMDARHQHALLTVINKKVLDAIMVAMRDAGLNVTLVEPVLMALSRTLQRLGRDQERPVMVVNLSKESFELGISYQGQLLLDYRPGGRVSHQSVSDIVQRHFARLDRYCQRYFHFSSGSLQEVFLCGSTEDVQRTQSEFQADSILRVESIPLHGLDDIWDFGNAEPNAVHAPLLGTQLFLQRINADTIGPNFMERIRAETRTPILPGLIKSAWPIAAALLVSVAMMGVGHHQEGVVQVLDAELKELQPSSDRISQWRMKQMAADKKIAQMQTIQKKLPRTNWQDMVTTVGHCLPEDVWLDGINVQSEGKMQLTGAAYGEGGIYEFIRYLQQYPSLSQVALEQTQPATLASGPAIKFDLNCDLTGRSGGAKQEKKP